jgi:hypothetical protein
MRKLSLRKVRAEIDKQHGNVTMVAKTFRVTRQTVYTFLKENPELKQALDDEREKMIDNVESALYEQALSGNTTAMIFFLKTQGKGRGYIERQETVDVDLSNLTDHQLERIKKGDNLIDVLADKG